jgi:hypothetical protein
VLSCRFSLHLASFSIAENPLRLGSWQESCGTLRTFVGLTRRMQREGGNRTQEPAERETKTALEFDSGE